MKKFIACALLSVLLFNLQVSAEMRFRLSADSDEVIGTGAELGVNEIVKIIVLKGGNIDTNDIQQVQDNLLYFNVLTRETTSGAVDKTIDFSAFEENKIYKVFAIEAFTSDSNIVNKDFGDRYTEIGYAGLASRNQYMQDIRSALGISAEKVKEELVAKGIFMGIDYEMFKLASAERVAETMFSDKGRLNLAELDIKTLAGYIDDAVLGDVLNGANSGQVSTEYISELIYNDARYADIKTAFAKIPEDKKANILSDISKKSLTNYAQLEQEIKNSAVINAFNYADANAEILYQLLCDFATVVEPNLNIGKLSALNSSARSIAVKNLSDKKYATVEALKNAIDEIKTSDTIINAPAGGGGGGGGSAIPTSGGHQGITLTPFSDMEQYKWAEDALYYLAQKNIDSGYGDNTFKPEKNITRAEFVKIIVSCFFDEDEGAEMPFADVGADKWYSKYIAAALAQKIVSGLSETEFGPDRYMTRQDMAVVLYNTAKIIDFDTDTEKADIADDGDISEYAKEAVYALKNAGVINGYEDGSFRPKNNANRAETVQMVYNFLIKRGELANEE